MSGAPSEGRAMARAAGVVGLATLTSRVAGFVRDMFIAYFFGAGPAADAFFVAFRIPNLLRRLFAEGTLTIAFVPIFTEVLTKKGKSEALLLARSTAAMLALALGLTCALGLIFAEQVVSVIAPGFTADGPSRQLAVELTRWCLPYIFFISLTALAAGVLNSLNHFFAPAFSPVLLNLALIGSSVILAPRVEPPVLSLAIGVILGGAAQFLLQLPYLKAQGLKLAPAWDPQNPHLRRILKLMGPAAFGAAVYQLTVLINTMLASWLPVGSVSYLYYADRLIEFPLGIFAIALATAILPSLSRQAAAHDHQALVATMGFGLRLTLFINLPAMVGLLVLAYPLVELLFARGQFGPESTRATAQALMGYGVGLWAAAGVRSVLPAFYALKDTRTPVKVGAFCLLVNLAVSLALMKPLAHVGLALATSVSGAANMLILLWLLRKRLGPLGLKAIFCSGLKAALASGVMALAVAAVAYLPPWPEAGGALTRAGRPLAAIVAGMAVFVLAAWALKLPELKELREVARQRKG
jgi:putative peptidoglycan lipid II flippase